MHEIVIPIPTAVSEQVRNRVKHRMADTYGGWTAYLAEGGWTAPNGEKITEDVEVITAADNGESDVKPAAFARATASHVADETDEDVVMWFVRPITDMGFES